MLCMCSRIADRVSGEMETAGEERVRVGQGLRKLEDAAAVLEEGAHLSPPKPISIEFPKSVFSTLSDLTTVSSRDDAERLLATGVSMWNSVIALEDARPSDTPAEALVKLRHVAVDCIYMASTVLGGISARYNIDEITLLKFYSSCGRKYASATGDMEMASVCFSKAAEFAKSAKALGAESETGARALSKAMFDLLLGRAECSWDAGETRKAEDFVAQASDLLSELPAECEYMASVLFNLGLLAYQAKEIPKALIWLKKSMDTRSLACNPEVDLQKQAKTVRLAGVCHIALKDFPAARAMMDLAEETHHDPVGSYLSLKLDVLMKSDDVLHRLLKILQDANSTLDVCMASLAILTDAQRVQDACAGFEKLWERYTGNVDAIAGVIGPRYFEACAAVGNIDKALEIVDKSLASLGLLSDASNESQDTDANCKSRSVTQRTCDLINKWCALLLFSGSALAERSDFYSAFRMLARCFEVAAAFDHQVRESEKIGNHTGADATGAAASTSTSGNAALENKATLCRLTASCAYCAVSGTKATFPPCPLADVPSLHQKRVKLIQDGILYAERAKQLDSDDLAARLLLFRLLLVDGNTERASKEMRLAAREVTGFDAGALAEAACDAKLAGSSDAVLAVLQCILRGTSSMSVPHIPTTSCLDAPGFIGTVLVSSVSLIVERVCRNRDTPLEESSIPERATFAISEQDAEIMLALLQDGHSCITTQTLSHGFADKLQPEVALKYLCDVAWNTGRRAAERGWFNLWKPLFDICHSYCELRAESVDVLETQRVSKLMASSAIVEESTSSTGAAGDLEKALHLLAEARQLTARIRELGGDDQPREDSIAARLPVLEALCHAARRDHGGISAALDYACSSQDKSPTTLEHIAAIAYDMKPKTGDDNCANIRLDNVARALTGAMELRLKNEDIDVKSCAVTARELITVELLRISGKNHAYSIMQRSIGLLKEYSREFPRDEQRWLTATAWDTAQILCRVGRKAEAQQWAELARESTKGNAALETYLPKIDSFIDLLQGTSQM